MANFLYIDNSNVWIEGMHVSAVKTGKAPDMQTAMMKGICDYDWKIDFGRPYEFARGQSSEVGRAVLYGSRPPANDSLWAIAKRQGFDVVIYDRNAMNKEKKIDTSIVADIITDSYELMRPGIDEVTLVAGDKDYVPAIAKLRGRDFRFHVAFWGHAAHELKDAATTFTSLDTYLDHLRLK